MHLEFLQVDHVRNLEKQQIFPGPGLNQISGKNASGKTALLESIFILSRGKSFRTPRLHDVMQHGAENLLVYARLNVENRGQVHTGIEKGKKETQIRYDGTRILALSEQSRRVPISLVTQDSHLFITSGPAQRRHWLDWAMFHVEPAYLDQWKSYMRALRHRNSLLKKGVTNRDLYRAWEQAMVESGLYLSASRTRFLDQLTTKLNELTRAIFPGSFTLEMSSDWPKDSGSEFSESWQTDLKNGYTRQGAHNADIRVKQSAKSITTLFSRGQIKLFMCLLTIAQNGLQAERTGVRPVILIDDYKAELDSAACEYLLGELGKCGAQSFITDTEFVNKNRNIYSMFHVEQGMVVKA